MHHLKKTKTLDRKKGPRTALIKNLAGQVILFEKVKTTTAKAKIIKPYVEKLITRSKQPSLATQRYLRTKLNSPQAIKKLCEVYGPQYQERKGGYLKIIKDRARTGDGAQMAYLIFVK